MTHQTKPLTRQCGFTLLEAMVALVIFSVGLLGLAGMQMAGLQNNQDAMLRTIAIQQIYDMADRIRANRAGFTAGAYDGIPATANPIACGPCSTAEQANNDFALWEENNASVLPGGTGTIAPGAGGTVVITVQWNDRATNDVSTASMEYIPFDT